VKGWILAFLHSSSAGLTRGSMPERRWPRRRWWPRATCVEARRASRQSLTCRRNQKAGRLH